MIGSGLRDKLPVAPLCTANVRHPVGCHPVALSWSKVAGRSFVEYDFFVAVPAISHR